jgi:hypothetical protein
MCCGRGRLGRGTSGLHSAPMVPGIARLATLTFEYVGKTRLVVVGPATGRQYRFDRPGSRLEVDPRDSTAVAAIPLLRKISPSAPGR